MAPVPKGNLDDALIAEAAKREPSAAAKEAMSMVEALAHSPAKDVPLTALGSPFEPAPAAKFSISLSPSVRGLKINSAHPLESTVEEVGGEIRLSLSW